MDGIGNTTHTGRGRGSPGGSSGPAASQNDPEGVQACAMEAVNIDLRTAEQILTGRGFTEMEMLGGGKHARVYKVRSAAKRKYAVKIIDLDKTSQSYRVDLLPSHLQILSSVVHKNIAAIYEILQAGRQIFIIMEFVPHGTIADYLKKHKEIPEKKAKPMFAQILEAIVYMHDLNVAHRNITLEHILLDKQLNPKLTGFSYATVVESENGVPTLNRTFCGTITFVSPEILQQQPYNPKAADIWSLGVCLFIMLNNTVPFKVNDMAVMIQTQLTRSYKFKAKLEPTFSAQVKDIIKRMLEPEMGLRATARELIVHFWVQTK